MNFVEILLSEKLKSRNAMLDVETGSGPPPLPHGMASEWIKRLPVFDFPDDEIG